MPARILVIDNDQASQRATAYHLREGGYDVVTASDGPEGLKLVDKGAADLILVEAALPGLDGYAIATRVNAGRTTSIPVLLCGPEQDVESRVRGVRAGASDYLVKPYLPAELLARVKGLLVRFAPKDGSTPGTARGRLYAFYGAKGGVGTTTILLNAGIALNRERQRRVIAVDAKLQFGDIRVFLDLGLHNRSMVDLVTAPSIDADLVKNVVVTHESGLDVLLAPPSPEAAELVTVEHLAQMFQVLRTMYDYVLVDTDQRLDDHNLQVLDAASTIFVVMNADLSSIKNVRLLLATMANLAFDREQLRLVLNRATAITGINLQSVEAALERKINHRIANDYRQAMSALNSGAPFMYRNPTGSLSRSVAEFANAIDERRAAPVEVGRQRPGIATARP
jgi:pilus assembly protein CpaE